MRFLKTYIFTRKFLSLVIVLGIMFLAFGGNSYATAENATLVDKTDVVGIVDLVLKVIYILLWPLVFIAGMSLDNTLVYGTVLHLDAPLWAFWNIMKNFANFALGFLVLFAIIKNIFSFGKADDKRKPQKIIVQTLIAGVLVQISRFVMAALVDLSTVATYAIGALPLNVVSSTPLGDKKIMSSHVNMDLTKFQEVVDGTDYYNVRYSVPLTKLDGTVGVGNFSECKTEDKYIVGRMDGGTGFRNEGAFGGNKNACVSQGQLVFFNEFPDTYKQDKAMYDTNLKAILKQGSRSAREQCNFVIKIGGRTSGLPNDCATALATEKIILDDIYTQGGQEKYSDNRQWLDPENTTQTGEYGSTYGDKRLQENPLALTLDSIVDKSKGFVGPLVTMYSSMLDFAQLANTRNDSSFGEIGGEMLIKTGFAIGLFFPLLALAIVLIIRVGFLWAVIVGSPFLVLVKAFGWEEKLPGSLKDHFNLANIIQVIFAPVVTVFALSISLIFMSALMASINTGGTAGWDAITTVTAGGSQIMNFFNGCLELKLDGFDFGGTLDVFSWFLINMIGIGLMRGIVFAAIRLNSIGDAVGKKVQDFGSNFFQTLPILPMPGGGEPVGIGSLGRVLYNMPEKATEMRDAEGFKRADKFVNPGNYGEESGGLSEKHANEIVTAIGNGKGVEETITSITKKEASEVKTNIQDQLPTLFATIDSKITDVSKKETTIKALETYADKLNAYEEYAIDKNITDGMTFTEATTKLSSLTTPKEAADRATLDEAKITKKLKKNDGTDEDYIISIDPSDRNKYIFTPK